VTHADGPAGGSLAMGQDQDSVGGVFEEAQALFNGGSSAPVGPAFMAGAGGPAVVLGPAP
jgi:hypothetical protein